jgi:hypothetical protein
MAKNLQGDLTMQRIKEILTEQRNLLNNTKISLKNDGLDFQDFTEFFLEVYANNLELTSRVNHLLNIKED